MCGGRPEWVYTLPSLPHSPTPRDRRAPRRLTARPTTSASRRASGRRATRQSECVEAVPSGSTPSPSSPTPPPHGTDGPRGGPQPALLRLHRGDRTAGGRHGKVSVCMGAAPTGSTPAHPFPPPTPLPYPTGGIGRKHGKVSVCHRPQGAYSRDSRFFCKLLPSLTWFRMNTTLLESSVKLPVSDLRGGASSEERPSCRSPPAALPPQDPPPGPASQRTSLRRVPLSYVRLPHQRAASGGAREKRWCEDHLVARQATEAGEDLAVREGDGSPRVR